MEKQINDLSGVKVGDKLWHITLGWVEVIGAGHQDSYCIRTKHSAYDLNGKNYSNDLEPTLFWDKPEFEYPKKPKTVTINERKMDDILDNSIICPADVEACKDIIKSRMGF